MRCSKYFIGLLCGFLVLGLQAFGQNADSQLDAFATDQLNGFLLRDIWQKPDTLLQIMQIKPAEAIAEIGAGEGYFTLKLAHQVGPDGKVLALDIDQTRLNKLKLVKRYSQQYQIEIIQNQPDKLGLKDNSLDKIVMVNTYHELADYEAILKQCRAALKPKGQLFIIDSCNARLDNEKTSRKKLFNKHSIRLAMVEEDLKTAGFNINLMVDKYTKQPENINWFIITANKE